MFAGRYLFREASKTNHNLGKLNPASRKQTANSSKGPNNICRVNENCTTLSTNN